MLGRVIIGLPLRKDRNIKMDTAAWVMHQVVQYGCQPVWVFGPSPEMARNALVEQQLKDQTVGAIVFVDWDVVPPLDAIPRMFALDKDIVTAPTEIWVDGQKTWNVSVDFSGGYLPELPQDPFKVYASGFGCVAVRRAALEAMEWPWFSTVYKPMGDDGRCIRAGEDEYFCCKAKQAGFEIWADPGLRCRHFNEVDLSQVEASAKERGNGTIAG